MSIDRLRLTAANTVKYLRDQGEEDDLVVAAKLEAAAVAVPPEREFRRARPGRNYAIMRRTGTQYPTDDEARILGRELLEVLADLGVPRGGIYEIVARGDLVHGSARST